MEKQKKAQANDPGKEKVADISHIANVNDNVNPTDSITPVFSQEKSEPQPEEKFDFELVRTNESFEEDFEDVRTYIAIRKPSQTEWLRVHPEPNYRGDVYVLEIPERDGFGKENYIIFPKLFEKIARVEYPISHKRLYTCVNQTGTIFIWPIKLAEPGLRWDSWNKSAERIASKSMKSWVRLYPNKQAQCYGMKRLKREMPSEPKFPTESFSKIIEIAFDDFFIKTVDHPVLADLRGESGNGF